MTDGSTAWNYTYDVNGLRTKRTNGTDTYNYIYTDGKLMQMTKGSDTLNFIYEVSGYPSVVKYNGTVYYYVTNLQGDVIAIVNNSGAEVVGYTYDAWGKLLTTSGTMAATLGTLNPLRYRGYVYDHETGLYYLQSRYYNPEIGRFLNADAYASTGGLLGKNMFAYCENNPVIGFDPTGYINWGGVFAGIGIGALAALAVAATVATMGVASPLLAATAGCVGTAVSTALIETSAVTTAGAIAEAPVVYDTTIVTGYDRIGCSVIYDFENNTTDVYMHKGVQSKYELSTTWGTGFVFNYDGQGSYAGEFVDANQSINYKGASIGIDVCTSPDNINNNNFMGEGTSAVLVTSGMGMSFTRAKLPAFAYDYYWYISST